jgi:hypothetical protein
MWYLLLILLAHVTTLYVNWLTDKTFIKFKTPKILFNPTNYTGCWENDNWLPDKNLWRNLVAP